MDKVTEMVEGWEIQGEVTVMVVGEVTVLVVVWCAVVVGEVMEVLVVWLQR